METTTDLKEMVREKYSDIALKEKGDNEGSCCGSGACCDTTVMADDYTKLEGYNPEADLGLGCGLPTEFAKIKKGDVVLDLGSGAGNDAFIALNETGETGKVIGIDFTPAMIERAKKNAEARGVKNVEFILGDIEKMPLSDNTADVVVSNCVLNLVPDKKSVFKEVFRVMKFGGHFSISDIVLVGELPEGIRNTAEMYAGCVSGAIQKSEYLDIINETGFSNVSLQKEKRIDLPDDILKNYLSEEEIQLLRNSGTGIYSITVYGEKPKNACCEPGAGCC
jgi:arsenite methyltransferase